VLYFDSTGLGRYFREDGRLSDFFNPGSKPLRYLKVPDLPRKYKINKICDKSSGKLDIFLPRSAAAHRINISFCKFCCIAPRPRPSRANASAEQDENKRRVSFQIAARHTIELIK
jgi:hypothetical protein